MCSLQRWIVGHWCDTRLLLRSGLRLIPGTELRPADELALCNTRTALRVSISAPHAQAGVASTATQTRVADKLAHYGPTSKQPPRPEDQLHRRPLERLWQTTLLHVDRFPYPQQVHLAQA